MRALPPPVIAPILVAIAGCATAPPLDSGGFLKNNSGLVATTGDGVKERARSLAVGDLEPIPCFVVAEPVVRAPNLSPDQSRLLEDDLKTNLSKALAEIRPLKPSGGECAEVRSAVAGVTKSNVIENLILGVVILPVLPSNGAVALEAEVLGPGDRRSLAALQWSKTGSPLSIIDGLSEIGQARSLTRDFARRVAKLVKPAP